MVPLIPDLPFLDPTWWTPGNCLWVLGVVCTAVWITRALLAE